LPRRRRTFGDENQKPDQPGTFQLRSGQHAERLRGQQIVDA
jgi:hypothetical protein